MVLHMTTPTNLHSTPQSTPRMPIRRTLIARASPTAILLTTRRYSTTTAATTTTTMASTPRTYEVSLPRPRTPAPSSH